MTDKPTMTLEELYQSKGAISLTEGEVVVWDLTDGDILEAGHECCDCGLVHRMVIELKGRKLKVAFYRTDERYFFSRKLEQEGQR